MYNKINEFYWKYTYILMNIIKTVMNKSLSIKLNLTYFAVSSNKFYRKRLQLDANSTYICEQRKM